MVAIFIKDLDRQKYVSLAFAVAIVLLTILSSPGREWIYLICSALLLLILSVSSTLIAEGVEERFSGYVLLKTLPVGLVKIIGTKFILQFMTVMVGTGVVSAILIGINGDGEMIRFGLVVYAWTAFLSLLLIALSFIGVYALGMVRFTTVAKVTAFTLILIPQILLYVYRRSSSLNLGPLRQVVAQSSIALPLVLAGALYGLGFLIALGIKRRR